jgi:hypothetical protein
MRPPPTTVSFDKGGEPSDDWVNWFRVHLFNVVSKDQGSGTTANRPINGLVVGSYYFDTDLNITIWYNGSGWYDAAGNSV